jgi:predicted PurR-regulated permease PerM
MALKNSLQKHAGLIILIISLVLILVILYLLRNIILPFLIGLVLAYILLPPMSWIERHLPRPGKNKPAKRIISILLVFILVLLVVGGVGYFVVLTTVNSFLNIVSNAPDYISQSFATIRTWLDSLRGWLPESTYQEVDNFISNLGVNLGNVFRNLFLNVATSIPATITYAMGFASLPIFLYYLLKDHERLTEYLYSWLPDKAARHLKNIFNIINEVLGGYLRAQLLMGLFVGTLALIALLIIRAPFAFGLAAVAGITELIPVLGPWIGGTIAALVVLAINPAKVIWVIIAFFAIQLVENTLLVPRIQGYYLHVHPVIAVVLIVLGAALAGFWGVILAIPLTSTVVMLTRYIIKAARKEDGNLLQS